jgi:hypothetical protein
MLADPGTFLDGIEAHLSFFPEPLQIRGYDVVYILQKRAPPN